MDKTLLADTIIEYRGNATDLDEIITRLGGTRPDVSHNEVTDILVSYQRERDAVEPTGTNGELSYEDENELSMIADQCAEALLTLV